MKLKVKLLSEDALLPTKKYPGDAGYDLYARYSFWIRPGETLIVPLGIAIEIPSGWVGLIKEKSGSDFWVGAGVVDSGYRGELKVKVRNVGGYGMKFTRHENPIAQLVIVPYLDLEVREAKRLSRTERGERGGINEGV